MINDENGDYPGRHAGPVGRVERPSGLTRPDQQVATNYSRDSVGCYIPAKSADWTYVQGDPVVGRQ